VGEIEEIEEKGEMGEIGEMGGREGLSAQALGFGMVQVLFPGAEYTIIPFPQLGHLKRSTS